MRWFLNAILTLAVLTMALGLTWHRQQAESQKVHIEAVRQALRAIQSEAIYHPAVNQVEAEPTGFAKNIDPGWFKQPPTNALLRSEGVRCPWLDQPIGSYRSRFNPVYIVADADHAAFWYNPARGVIRARVPMQLSQKATVDLYNRVNGTALHSDEVAWMANDQTTRVDAGPPEAVVSRDAATETGSIGPGSPSDSSSPPSSAGSNSSGPTHNREPGDPVLRDFGGGK